MLTASCQSFLRCGPYLSSARAQGNLSLLAMTAMKSVLVMDTVWFLPSSSFFTR